MKSIQIAEIHKKDSFPQSKGIDNKLITLPLWSGYVQIFVVLFVLKKSEERKQIYGKKTSVG